MCRKWLVEDSSFLDTEDTGLDKNAEIVGLATVNTKSELNIKTLAKVLT